MRVIVNISLNRKWLIESLNFYLKCFSQEYTLLALYPIKIFAIGNFPRESFSLYNILAPIKDISYN
jgi:hypothetical protein